MEMKKYKLGEIGEIRMCKRILKEETNSVGGVPFFKIGTFGGQTDVFITKEKFKEYKNAYSYPKKGDILISAAGTIGRTVVFDGKDAYFQDSNIVWIENDESKVLNEYLFYCYKNIRWTTSVGSTILRLYNDDIRNTDIIVPHLSEQKKISSVLSSLDDKIILNKKINSKLEAMAKRLYDYWFVQFDYPDKNGKPYKTSGGKMVWNEVLKRKIPEGWEVKRLGEVCDFRNGINYEKNNSGDKIYKIVNVRNITATTFFLNQNDFDEICLQSKIADNYLIPEISILIARSGSPGATRVIMNVKNNVIFCGFIICMEKFTPKYKFYFTYFLKKLENTSATKTGGSILQNVSQDTLKRLSVIIPPKEKIDEFNEKILPIFNYQLTIQKEIQKLTNLRDRLLPLLMNGQVEVE